MIEGETIMNDFKDGDFVYYKLSNEDRRTGYVRGVAGIEMPVIGRMMIVEDLLNFPTSNYKFTCFAIPEIHIEKVIANNSTD